MWPTSWSFTMPSWAASNSLQKRLVKFLLRRTVGQFLKADLDDENLDVQLSGGQLRLKNALNDAITGLPVVVRSGTIGLISVSIPWTQLWTGHCELQIEDLVIKTKFAAEDEGDIASSVDESDVMNAYGSTAKQRPARTNMAESIAVTEGGVSILASSIYIADDFLRAETLGYGEKDEIFINKDVERLVANAHEERAQFYRSRSKLAADAQAGSSNRIHNLQAGDKKALSPNLVSDSDDEFEDCNDALPHPGSPGGSVKGLQVVSEMVDRIISAINIRIQRVTVELDVATHEGKVINTLRLAVDNVALLDEKSPREEKTETSFSGATGKRDRSHASTSKKSRGSKGSEDNSESTSSDNSNSDRDHPAGIEYKVIQFRTLHKLTEIRGLRLTMLSKQTSTGQSKTQDGVASAGALLSAFNNPIQAHLRIHRRMPFSELAPVEPKRFKKDSGKSGGEDSMYMGPMPGEFREARVSDISAEPLPFSGINSSRIRNNMGEEATTSGWDVSIELGDAACVLTKEQLAALLEMAKIAAPLIELNAEHRAMRDGYNEWFGARIPEQQSDVLPQLARWINMACKHVYVAVVPQKTELLDGWQDTSLAVLRLKLETVKHLALYTKGIGAKWEGIPPQSITSSLPGSPTGVPIARSDSAPPANSATYMDTEYWAAMTREAAERTREKRAAKGDIYTGNTNSKITISAYIQSISLYDNDPQCYPVVRQLIEVDRSLFTKDRQNAQQTAIGRIGKNSEKYDIWMSTSKADLALTINVGPIVVSLNKELSDRIAVYQSLLSNILSAQQPDRTYISSRNPLDAAADANNDVTRSIERLMMNLTLQDTQKTPSNIAVCSPLIRTWIQLPTTTSTANASGGSDILSNSRSHAKEDTPVPGHFCVDAVDAVITNVVNGVATSSQARDDVPDGHMRLPHIQELLESRKNVAGSGIRVECEALHFYIQSMEGSSSIDHIASVHSPSDVLESIREAVSVPRPHIEITTVASKSNYPYEPRWHHPPAFDAFAAVDDDIRVRMAPETELSTSLEFERQAVEQSRLVVSCHLPESDITLDRAAYYRINAVLNEFMLWQSVREQMAAKTSVDKEENTDIESVELGVSVLVDMPLMVATIITGSIHGDDDGSDNGAMAASISIPPKQTSTRYNSSYARQQRHDHRGDGESQRVRLTNTQLFMSNAIIEKGKMYISAESNQMRLSSYMDNVEVEAVVSHTFATSEAPIFTPQLSVYMLTSPTITEESEIVLKAAWTTFDYRADSSCFRDLESFFSSSGTSGMVQPPPKPMRLSLNVQNSSFRWTPANDPAINSAVVSLDSLSVIVGINTPAPDRDNEELRYYIEGMSIFGRSTDSHVSVPVDVSSDAWVSTGRFWKDHGYSVLLHMDMVDLASNSKEGEDGPLVDLKLYSEALVLNACSDSVSSLPQLAKDLIKEIGNSTGKNQESQSRSSNNKRMTPQVLGQVSDDIFGDIEEDTFAMAPSSHSEAHNLPMISTSRRSSTAHAKSHSTADDYSFTHDFENGQDDIGALLVDEYFAPNADVDVADEYEVVGGKILSPTSPKQPAYSQRRQSFGHEGISGTSLHRNMQPYKVSSRSPNDKPQFITAQKRQPLDIKPTHAAGKRAAGDGSFGMDDFEISDDNDFSINDYVNMDSGSDILSTDDDDFSPGINKTGVEQSRKGAGRYSKLQNRLPGQQFAGDDSVVLEPDFPAPTFIPRNSSSRKPSRVGTAIDILDSHHLNSMPVIVTIPEETESVLQADNNVPGTSSEAGKAEAGEFGIIDNYFKEPALGEYSSDEGESKANGNVPILCLTIDIARVEVNLHSGQDWFESIEASTRPSPPADIGYIPTYMDNFDDSVSVAGADLESKHGRVSASMPEPRGPLDFHSTPLGSPQSPYRSQRQQQQSRLQRRSPKPKIELRATHVHAEYKQYSESSSSAYDLGLNVGVLEVLDQLESSEWSKFLTRRRESKTGLPATLHSLANVRNRQLLTAGTADSDRVTSSHMRRQKSSRWPDSNVEPMICVQVESVRPYDTLKTEELRVDAEISPLRCYIHQDALDFLIGFFESAERRSMSLSSAEQAESADEEVSGPLTRRRAFGRWPTKGIEHPYFQIVRIAPINVIFDYKPRRIRGLAATGAKAGGNGSGGGDGSAKAETGGGRRGPTSPSVNATGSPSHKPVELLNLFPLEDAEMTLSTVKVRGVAGVSKLVRELGRAWLPHLAQTQIPGVVSGLTPLRSLVNIGSGVADLVILPIEQYRRDGRLVQGIKRGAQSFARTTTLEALQLGAKVAVNAQTLLEQAGDILNVDVSNSGDSAGSGPHSHDSSWPDGTIQSPRLLEGSGQRHIEIDLADWPDYISADGQGPMSVAGTEHHGSGSGGARRGRFNKSKYARQPENLSEGMRQAYSSLRSNVGSAVQTILAIPVVVQESTEDGDSGEGALGRSPVHGSVRAVVRAVPVAVLKPMIGATEAVSKTLLGLRNTMEPTRRGQLEDKYKSRSLGAKKSYPS
ncbi:autophagy- protein 2 [Coemansia sp. RSA 1358]|nr:autophagy- protein 2 [Coemansia sp. RSA 1358]